MGQAEAVLVDPSCSNSGTHADARNGVTADRLRRLASFQEKALMHALSFPKVRRVVYCTCSVHERENELVVAATLRKSPAWTLEEALPAWPRRGIPCSGGGGGGGRGLEEGLARCCLRVDPEKDHAHGFFIACLVRK